VIVVLGLLAAAFYGVGDFAGGYASRSRNVLNVLLYSYPVGVVLMVAMLPLFPGHVTGHTILFGILGGIAGEVGVITLYGLMAVAPMNIVSPITAVLAAIVPVAFGVVIGERPHLSAWIGIVLGIGAVVLVSRTSEDNPHGPVSTRVLSLSMLAGVGFGLYFIFLARAGSDSGIWPVVISRLASALLIIPLARVRRSTAVVRGRLLGLTMVAGGFDALANLFFLLATHRGLLSLASVLTSLYPAFTVILAVGLLHEHTSRAQRVGLGLAAIAIVLITI
jgi:drug/metabolite transporter (DMT)-like permease